LVGLTRGDDVSLAAAVVGLADLPRVGSLPEADFLFVFVAFTVVVADFDVFFMGGTPWI
jgi:hypothetical protein